MTTGADSAEPLLGISAVVAANAADPELQRSNVSGAGHEFWVDRVAGYTADDQAALVELLLSLDDAPEVLP